MCEILLDLQEAGVGGAAGASAGIARRRPLRTTAARNSRGGDAIPAAGCGAAAAAAKGHRWGWQRPHSQIST